MKTIKAQARGGLSAQAALALPAAPIVVASVLAVVAPASFGARAAESVRGAPPAPTRPAPSRVKDLVERPACPAGWTDFKNPIIGLEAHVPTNFWVRLRGGTILTVERADRPTEMVFLLPLRPRVGSDAPAISRQFDRFVAGGEPRWQSHAIGEDTPDRASRRFTSAVAGQPVEGRYCAILAAGGSMAFIVGSIGNGCWWRSSPIFKPLP